LFDAGNVVFTVPLFGEFSDVIWAPMAAYWWPECIKERQEKWEGGNFYRGNCSFTDFIPSFTLMWFYHYVIKKKWEMIRLFFKETQPILSIFSQMPKRI
jgi:hypothetical protein